MPWKLTFTPKIVNLKLLITKLDISWELGAIPV